MFVFRSEPDAAAALGVQFSVIVTGAVSIDGDSTVAVVCALGVVLTRWYG